MAVRLKPRFDKAAIHRALQERAARIEKAILSRLQRVGEQFVADARNNGDYKDQTGNLRSSVGYIVLQNGKTVNENLQGKSEGISKAREVLVDISTKYPRGLVLIVVAGMDYAAYVEAKGKDVLTGSSKIAVNRLTTALEAIQKKVL